VGKVYDALKRAEYSPVKGRYRRPMKVFISWSGERSKAVAEALRYWLPKVIQALEPWTSADDIEKGTRWRSGLAQELERSRVGIICLTPENLDSTWLHFEAGALSKQQQGTYVCTFLVGLEPTDVREPMAQFQATRAEKEDVRKLVMTINNTLEQSSLPESELRETFEVWWPKLEQRFVGLMSVEKQAPQIRTNRDLLEEILGLVRFQTSSQSSALKSNQTPRYLTTLDWAPEDAKLLHDQCEFIRHEFLEANMATDQEFINYMEKIKTDKVFAMEELQKLKEIRSSVHKDAGRELPSGGVE
jgi:hypothetical protein